MLFAKPRFFLPMSQNIVKQSNAECGMKEDAPPELGIPHSAFESFLQLTEALRPQPHRPENGHRINDCHQYEGNGDPDPVNDRYGLPSKSGHKDCIDGTCLKNYD